MYPIHENESGIFQELAKKKDLEFGQLNYLLIKPGCSRGGHYHKRKREWFCCIEGECELEIRNLDSGLVKKVHLDSRKKEFVSVEPPSHHSVRNPNTKESCKLIIITNEEFDESSPDTYKED